MFAKIIPFLLMLAIANPLCCCDIVPSIIKSVNNQAEAPMTCCQGNTEEDKESKKPSSGCEQERDNCPYQKVKEHQHASVEKTPIDDALFYELIALIDWSLIKSKASDVIDYAISEPTTPTSIRLHMVNCIYLI